MGNSNFFGRKETGHDKKSIFQKGPGHRHDGPFIFANVSDVIVTILRKFYGESILCSFFDGKMDLIF